MLPGWPRFTAHFVWASPVVADVNGDGLPEIIAASDALYVWRGDGTLLDGWPCPLQGYAVAQPLVADVDGDGRLEIVQVGDAVYAWHADGRMLSGFPVPLPAFVWGRPVLLPTPGGVRLVMGAWNGAVYALDVARPRLRLLAQLGAPLFAPLAFVRETQIVAATWAGDVWLGDGTLQGDSAPPTGAVPWVVRTLSPTMLNLPDVPENTPLFVYLAIPRARRAVLWYYADHEDVWHPVPLVKHGDALMGLVQPFPAGRTVRLFAQLWPDEGDTPPIPGRLWNGEPPAVGKRFPPAPQVWTYRTRPVWSARVCRRSRRLWRRFIKWMGR